ncbi:MAG: HAD family hydrolase [Lachnospiraceae bacterium]|nr:HAD family hydrolase [Lachnospiraceae bacterium]
MKNKAIFLDRDGTINVDKDYLYKIEDFEFLPKVPEALRMLQEAGYLLIIITNQSGIARGYFTEADYNKLDAWMLETLEKELGIRITVSSYCPHHPQAMVPEYRQDCTCRKPGTALFMQAVQKYRIDLSRSYAIGDRLRDVSICKGTDCQGFLIGNTESLETVEAVRKGDVKNVSYVASLFEAAIKICAK